MSRLNLVRSLMWLFDRKRLRLIEGQEQKRRAADACHAQQVEELARLSQKLPRGQREQCSSKTGLVTNGHHRD